MDYDVNYESQIQCKLNTNYYIKLENLHWGVSYGIQTFVLRKINKVLDHYAIYYFFKIKINKFIIIVTPLNIIRHFKIK